MANNEIFKNNEQQASEQPTATAQTSTPETQTAQSPLAPNGQPAPHQPYYMPPQGTPLYTYPLQGQQSGAYIQPNTPNCGYYPVNGQPVRNPYGAPYGQPAGQPTIYPPQNGFVQNSNPYQPMPPTQPQQQQPFQPQQPVQSPLVTPPNGQPYYGTPYGQTSPNQTANGRYTPYYNGGQYTPYQPDLNRPPVTPITAPKAEKPVDPERDERKGKVKQLANASAVPLLIYQFGGSIIIALIATVLTAIYGEIKGNHILSDPDFLYLANGFLSILFMSVPFLITALWTKQPLKSTVAFKKFKPSIGIAIIMLGFGAIAVAQYGGGIITQYFSMIFGEEVHNPAADFGTGPVSMIISLFCVGIIPAFMEEFAFRGVLLGTARKYLSDGLSIMLNAILFSLLHGNLFQIPFTFALGLYLSYAVVYTGSIWPAVIIHGVNNVLAVLMTYAQNAATSDLVTYVIGGAYYLVMLLVGLCGLIFLIKATGEQRTFTLSKERGEHTKQNFGWFISSPWMIVFVIVMVLNAIVTQVAG